MEKRCGTGLGEDGFSPETSEGVCRLDRALRSFPILELSGSGASQAAKEDLSIKKKIILLSKLRRHLTQR